MTKIHYIPRSILERFKGDPSLLELDKTTGIASPRSIENAGQREDFWPEYIERGLMEKIDNDCPTLLRKKVYGADIIKINEEERRRLAVWIGLLMIRVPNNLRRMQEMYSGWRADPSGYIEELKQQGAMPIFNDRNNPMNQGIMALGQQLLGDNPTLIHLWMLSNMEVLARDRDPSIFPQLGHMFNRQLNMNYRAFATVIEKMHWRWLHDPNGGFVIGDDPVCRHGSQNNLDCGLNSPDVQAIVPLSRFTCLHLSNYPPDEEAVITVTTEYVRNCNRRQIANADRFAYGANQTDLRPDDEYADYGF